MRTTHILILCILLCIRFGNPLHAQTCGPEPVIDPNEFEGTGFFNFGCVTRTKSTSYKSALAVGQVFLGYTETVDTNTTLGFYARFFLPPFALKVKATQGDLLDRIQVTWDIDPLGPSPNGGFNIYRDNIFLATVDANIRSYNDFNVIAGRPYTYCVRGVNLFGEGTPGCAVGFQVPNGVVTGWISTLNGTPVPDASVTLTPMQGFSAKFDTGDGAIAIEETGTNPFLPPLDQNWTIAFWIKTDTTINGKIIGMDSLHIRARPSTQGGIAIAKTPTNPNPFLFADYPVGTKHDWHHVALTYDGNGNKYRLYFDGILVGNVTSNPVPPPDTINFGALISTGTWKGRLDELRIYNRKLDELDFDMVMEGTASSTTPYLTHYWKMDEELGTKSYDIVKRHKLYFCGVEFDTDRPPVHTAGITNEDGYYRIESASYGTGTTFLAKPKKNFYMHRSLKFERSENDYAKLPDFPITEKATIEMWVNSAGPDGSQCLVAKKWGAGNSFRIVLVPNGNNNDIRAVLNENVRTFGVLGSGYQHLAFVWDSTSRTMKLYKNGVQLGTTQTFPMSATNTGNWSDPDTAKTWLLGKHHDNNTLNYGGLIDEVAFYNDALSVATIQSHFQNSRDMQEPGLRVYFPLDEGSGTRINNVGSQLLVGGSTSGTEWSPLAAHQVIEPHIFTPVTRQVTLNPSVTSVDQVDFTDRSTIPVSGYVRYKDTDCFAQNVEILVNGESYHPQIFTDSTGKFLIDFDPGTTATLTPKFDDHIFQPLFWDVTNVSSPIAGILFNDLTTHTISGQVTGGLCRKSIISPSAVCRVKVSSVDGCFEKEIWLIGTPDSSGVFEFTDLPPLEKMTIVIEEHSNDVIDAFFQAEGGSIVDISKSDTVIDFIYFSQPEVLVEGLTLNACDSLVLEQGTNAYLDIKLVEQYYGGVCPLDTGNFHIINNFGDETVDTTMSGGLLHYEYRVGTPIPSPPYKKTLQIIGTTVDGNETSYLARGYVTGQYAYLNTFTTTLPETPLLILHDPPGDGSYSFLEKGEKICKEISFSAEVTDEFGLTGILDVGPDGEIPTFFGAPDVELVSIIGPSITGTSTISTLEENAINVCTSFSERISTSEDDLVVGAQGGDVYLGAGLNVEFGLVATLTWNEQDCEIEHGNGIQVVPGNWATTYMYSDWNIRNSVLYNLGFLYDLTTDPDEKAIYDSSIVKWNNILDNNAALKASTKFEKNISFDAGVTYEYSETSDTSITNSVTESLDLELETDLNFQLFLMGVGGGIIIHINHGEITGETSESGTEKGVTTGYVLSDDDVLDAFSVDIGIDSIYKTPVFDLKAGQTSCPWEYPSAKREGVLLEPVDEVEKIDIPSNERASYHFNLHNVSSTFETWTYAFTAGPESNPLGARIFCNGAPMNQIQWYAIPWGTSIPVTVEVERGADAYEYDSLEIVLYSACEDQRANDLGILPDTAEFLYDAEYITAHFIRPCSEVKINVPHQDWVVFPDILTPPQINDNLLRITVSGYDTMETDFKLIRIQYRPSEGNGAWINIPDSVRFNPNWSGLTGNPPLLNQDDNFTQFTWNTDGWQDGPYEIRAVAICTGDVSDKPGYSEVIKGRIDRDEPKLIGVPQPSDGVYHVGDEISITFDQEINCHDFLQYPLNARLHKVSTPNNLLNITSSCYENKIFIVPTDANEDLENEILRADVRNVKDLVGNVLTQSTWDFYVDRNELGWLTDSAGITKYEDETKSVNVKVHNRGGLPMAFTIENAPDWVHVSPDAGTLVPNEILEIQFTAADTLDVGVFTQNITLRTEPIGQNTFYMGGDEVIPFTLRNICRPPDWEVDPALYQQTMTLVCRVRIDATLPFDSSFVNATDPEDIVGAFINGQPRGTAKLTQSLNNQWFAFVTIYGNQADTGKTVTFEFFDASACLHYPCVFVSGSTFLFRSNGTEGSVSVPRILQNYGSILHEVPVTKGWNWISLNLAFPDNTINKVLNNIPNPAGDLIKSQTQFATYNVNKWTGSLTNIVNTSAYMYQGATKPNTIKITGTALNPATTHIPVVAGWNWIGYIPTYKLPVNTALATLSPTTGDIIKSQTQFAQFVSGSGWVGNLKSMQAPNGYLLKLTSSGTITYPPQSFTGHDPVESRSSEMVSSFWEVDATQFEHSMTFIGFFEYDKTDATTADMELGAFAGNELRGGAQAVYIEHLDRYMFFMTCFANKNGEQLRFKLYDATTGEIQNLDERMTFVPNSHQGSIEDPLPFTLQTTAIGELESELSFNVLPNPFRDETVCRIELHEAQPVQIIVTDMDGVVMYHKQIQANAGMNSFTWKGCTSEGNALSNGVYFIRLETEQGILTKKVVLQR